MPIEETNGEIRISAPLTEEDVAKLRAGQHVRFYGTIYTSRDAAHRKMLQAIEKGEPLPFDLKGQIIYYVGPTPPRPGRVIGSAGPTTSMRMDPFTPKLLELGLKMAIGKGGRGPRNTAAERRRGRRAGRHRSTRRHSRQLRPASRASLAAPAEPR